MATIFSRIIQGEIPCYKIAEDERFFAFLDINPVMKGHTLVVPKHEDDYIFSLDDDEIGAMMVFAKKVAKAIERPCLASASLWLSSDWKCLMPISTSFPSHKKATWTSRRNMRI